VTQEIQCQAWRDVTIKLKKLLVGVMEIVKTKKQKVISPCEARRVTGGRCWLAGIGGGVA
jgi:hypothetical protein